MIGGLFLGLGFGDFARPSQWLGVSASSFVLWCLIALACGSAGRSAYLKLGLVSPLVGLPLAVALSHLLATGSILEAAWSTYGLIVVSPPLFGIALLALAPFGLLMGWLASLIMCTDSPGWG
jgi:hypothetical protein